MLMLNQNKLATGGHTVRKQESRYVAGWCAKCEPAMSSASKMLLRAEMVCFFGQQKPVPKGG